MPVALTLLGDWTSRVRDQVYDRLAPRPPENDRSARAASWYE